MRDGIAEREARQPHRAWPYYNYMIIITLILVYISIHISLLTPSCEAHALHVCIVLCLNLSRALHRSLIVYCPFFETVY